VQLGVRPHTLRVLHDTSLGASLISAAAYIVPARSPTLAHPVVFRGGAGVSVKGHWSYLTGPADLKVMVRIMRS
jgi:hypothetical protein